MHPITYNNNPINGYRGQTTFTSTSLVIDGTRFISKIHERPTERPTHDKKKTDTQYAKHKSSYDQARQQSIFIVEA